MKAVSFRIFFLLASIVFVLFNPRSALADHNDPFVQVTCSPELDYFYIRTFHIGNTKAWNDSDRAKQIKKMIINQGIYDLKDFTEANYHCALPTRDISFDLLRYIPVVQGKCGENDAKFDIKINGKVAYTFDAYGEHCENITHQIKFYRPTSPSPEYDRSFIEDCIYPEGAPAFLGIDQPEASCEDVTPKDSSPK